LIEEFLGDEGCISSFVPSAAFLWIFKFSVVKGWFEHSIYHAQGETFSVFCSESLGVSKFPHLSTTKSFVSYPLEHLFYERGSFGIDLNMAFFILRSSPYDIMPNQQVLLEYPEDRYFQFLGDLSAYS
jgi:hypothetical protein